MGEITSNDLWRPVAGQSLDDRRPRSLADIVGQEHVVPRIRQGLLNGPLPQLMAFIGPSGVGKTTLAQAVARAHFCPNSHLLGDCCGECKTCLSPDLGGYQEYSEWTGLSWKRNGAGGSATASGLLCGVVGCFSSTGQDLSELHQKALLRRLEFTLARFILATTHKHKIVDALLNRFGANVYELRRPTLHETLTHLAQLCIKKKVQVTGEQLPVSQTITFWIFGNVWILCTRRKSRRWMEWSQTTLSTPS